MFRNNVINSAKFVHCNICYPINNSDRWSSDQKMPKNFSCSFHANDRVFALTHFIMNSKLFFPLLPIQITRTKEYGRDSTTQYQIGILSTCEIVPKRIICIICAISPLQFVFHIKTAFCAILLTSFNFSYISDSLPYTTYPSCCVSDKCGQEGEKRLMCGQSETRRGKTSSKLSNPVL